MLASTSEVYGDPAVNLQPEDYWDNVNPVGPRSVYDKAKRFAEAITAAYRRAGKADTGIARIFNTYGPGMRPDDGRVVPTFACQALRGQPLTVAGDGRQIRCPDITLATRVLGWRPEVSWRDGLAKTLALFAARLEASAGVRA